MFVLNAELEQANMFLNINANARIEPPRNFETIQVLDERHARRAVGKHDLFDIFRLLKFQDRWI